MTVVILLSLTLLRFSATCRYVRAANRQATAARTDGPLPRVSVFTPVRGADPLLKETIQSVLDQDYPDFDLHIIVDSRDDPAWPLVQQLVAELPSDRIVVSELTRKDKSCSLVCNALIQFVEEIQETSEIIAFCPSDGLVPRTWLRDMVNALSDPSVGSTLGNRWYMPARGMWGSTVRYLWNAAGVVYMWMYEIPWGGTLPFRISDVREAKLLERWGRSMIEDAHVPDAMKGIGKRMEFVPELIVVNHEEISLCACQRFLNRQLFWIRVYHKKFFALLVVSVLIGLATILPMLIILVGWAMQNERAVIWSAAGLLIHVVWMSFGLAIIDRSIRRRVRQRGDSASPYPWAMLWKIPLAIPLTQFMFLSAAVSSLFVRRMRWRGIEYDVRGPWDVEMLEYHPYVEATNGSARHQSVEG